MGIQFTNDFALTVADVLITIDVRSTKNSATRFKEIDESQLYEVGTCKCVRLFSFLDDGAGRAYIAISMKCVYEFILSPTAEVVKT